MTKRRLNSGFGMLLTPVVRLETDYSLGILQVKSDTRYVCTLNAVQRLFGFCDSPSYVLFISHSQRKIERYLLSQCKLRSGSVRYYLAGIVAREGTELD